MRGRDSFLPAKIVLALPLLLACAGPALAYSGPGAGLELVGYAMALLSMVATAFSAMVLWPLYAFIRRLRGIKDKPASADPDGTAPDGGTRPDGSGEPSHNLGAGAPGLTEHQEESRADGQRVS
jgi:hypothetical protein